MSSSHTRHQSPSFQFYPADLLASTSVALMTPAQEGGYLHLLCYDWMGDGIVDDDNILAALSRLGEGWLKGGSEIVRKCFIPHPRKDGFLTNPRLEKERAKQQEWKEKSREGGLKSAASRRKKGPQGGSTKAQPKVNRAVQPKGNTSSSSSNSTPIPPKGALPDADDEILEHIWNHHPKTGRERSSQAKVVAAWNALPQGDRPTLPVVTAAMAGWNQSKDWTKEDGRFVPGVHRWVKDQKWIDAPKAKPESALGGTLPASAFTI